MWLRHTSFPSHSELTIWMIMDVPALRACQIDRNRNSTNNEDTRIEWARNWTKIRAYRNRLDAFIFYATLQHRYYYCCRAIDHLTWISFQSHSSCCFRLRALFNHDISHDPPLSNQIDFRVIIRKKSQLTSLKYLIYMYLQSPPSISIALQLLSLYNIIDMNVFVLRARKQYDDKNIYICNIDTNFHIHISYHSGTHARPSKIFNQWEKYDVSLAPYSFSMMHSCCCCCWYIWVVYVSKKKSSFHFNHVFFLHYCIQYFFLASTNISIFPQGRRKNENK